MRRRKGHKKDHDAKITAAKHKAAAKNADFPVGQKQAASKIRHMEKDVEDAAAKKKKDAAILALKDGTLLLLKPIAEEINARLEKANKMSTQADDHRLAAAIKLEDARKRCRAAGIGFQRWCEDSVSQGYDEVCKLVAIGAAPDPLKALADMRAGAAARNRKMRSKRKMDASRDARLPLVGGGMNPAGPSDVADAALAALPDTAALDLMQGRVKALGMKVVSEEEAKRLTQFNKNSLTKEFATLAEVQARFLTLTAKDQLALVQWAAQRIGVKVSEDCQNDVSEIPEALRRAV